MHPETGAPRATTDEIVLASGSPRRRELLTRAGVAFDVVPPEVDEEMRPGEAPGELVLRLAREKAAAVTARLGDADRRLVLAADTIVVLGEDVLGKPTDPADARRMLARLTGRRHRVVTGVAVVRVGDPRCWSTAITSEVEMRAATGVEIEDYVATGEPLDKAGSYGVQGEGGRRFVTAIVGSETNVIGLPLEETLALLARARAETGAADPAAAGVRGGAA